MSTAKTTLQLNENLLGAAMKLAAPSVKTKKGVIELALEEFVARRQQKDPRELIGKVRLEDNYRETYKSMREDKSYDFD